MPVLLGRVGNLQVTVLRDTGCSGVVVKAQFVEREQYQLERTLYDDDGQNNKKYSFGKNCG